VLVAPVLGHSGLTNAEELFKIENFKRMVTEIQGSFYRMRKQYGVLRELGNIAVSTLSGGTSAAKQFLRWALKKPVGGKVLEGGDMIRPKLRELYLFDPPNGGDELKETLELALEWRAADPRRVLRIYHQLGFGAGGPAAQKLLGAAAPIPNTVGVRHSADGRVTFAVITPDVWQSSREGVVPPVSGLLNADQWPVAYGLLPDANECHVLYANYFLVDALRRSHFTDEV
jgi:hypothetical protein